MQWLYLVQSRKMIRERWTGPCHDQARVVNKQQSMSKRSWLEQANAVGVALRLSLCLYARLAAVLRKTLVGVSDRRGGASICWRSMFVEG